MPALEVDDIVSSLLKKGFTHKKGGSHDKFVYEEGEKTTSIFTVVSRGSGFSTISGGLVSQMARQVKLNNSQFKALVDCSLDGESYRQLLIEKGHLEGTSPSSSILAEVSISDEERQRVKQQLQERMNEQHDHEYYRLYGQIDENPVSIEVIDDLQGIGIEVEYDG